MGVETDLLLATRDQANDVLASRDPAKDFLGVYAKGTDQISLSALLGVFTEEGYKAEMIDEFPTVVARPDAEKAVYRVSPRLRRYVEEMPAEAIPDIVGRWMISEEFALTGWDESIAIAFLTDLKAMLSRGEARQHELWMTISV